MTGPRHSPTHQGESNDIENPAGESPAYWHLPPGADRLHVRADIGGGGIASPADPSGVGAGLVSGSGLISRSVDELAQGRLPSAISPARTASTPSNCRVSPGVVP